MKKIPTGQLEVSRDARVPQTAENFMEKFIIFYKKNYVTNNTGLTELRQNPMN